ncbi:hsp70 family protein [Polyangium sorediatum]|uniref:Hsp70 family protein n=1 Tax=Polyangium sorediatum TaxID=889274 RepID=A0ABT6NP41_9BACT|nr:hsp70 family protein [Polyangium sorediatum]MDI1430079.1 Hsp70 family protein [Polyangium sorediatum]
MSARRIVGIDLGTTHTVVAWADPASRRPPEVFPIPQLVSAGEIEPQPLLPSFLYAPLAGEALPDPFGDAPWVLGVHARRRGGEVAGRLVASSKSWLAHAAVDRTAPILPWGAGEDAEDLPRLSPVDAAARLLLHIKRAWNETFLAYPLEEQDVVLTVPASFDEDARELTVEAARRAGFDVRLLEEPQAAFYDYMARAGEGELAALCRRSGGEALVLVCDVGGGTTDLSLIRVRPGEQRGSTEVERVAVGRHLLLGGDNMDLALAHLCESRLIEAPDRLPPARFGQLVLACRAAKERLLGDDPPNDVAVTVLGKGARLIGSALSTRLSREEAERVVLDGFLPPATLADRPRRGGSALVAFGLPYERDVAITRHVAHFFARHAPGAPAPHALLLNGGVFRAKRIVDRLAEAIGAWSAVRPEILPHPDPDLAVARGAVVYGLSLIGRGVRIGGGSARGYYLGLSAGASGQRQAVCVVPRGAREGIRYDVPGRTFSLTVGRPVRFPLYASDEALDLPGTVVTPDIERFSALPPVSSAFEPGARPGEVTVSLVGELSAIGTLELACVEVAAEVGRRFRLTWDLRETSPDTAVETEGGVSSGKTMRPGVTAGGKRLEDAREAIARIYGKGRADVTPREVKDLVRELERILGERPTWTAETNRALFDVLWPGHKGRRRSADHERVFWQLAGYTLRPGFGHALDEERAANLFSLFHERVVFAQEARTWQHFWIAWRRIAGGLEEAAQVAIRDLVDPFLAPSEKRLKKPKGIRAEPDADVVDLASSLERVPPARRTELGGFLLERTWTDRDPRNWAAIGRIGARVPAYASAHHVIAPNVAERWLDHLLREKWAEMPTAPRAAMDMARLTGDRARDVSERVRRDVERRLVASGAREEWVRAVREVVAVEEADRAAFYGEGLPVGIRLVS